MNKRQHLQHERLKFQVYHQPEHQHADCSLLQSVDLRDTNQYYMELMGHWRLYIAMMLSILIRLEYRPVAV